MLYIFNIIYLKYDLKIEHVYKRVRLGGVRDGRARSRAVAGAGGAKCEGRSAAELLLCYRTNHNDLLTYALSTNAKH